MHKILTAHAEGYTFVRWVGKRTGLAVFKNEDGKEELFMANKDCPSWCFRYGKTNWEFIRSC
jgi:hypothetical protein